MSAAVQHHQAGQIPQAAALYQQILQREPRQPDALQLLGVTKIQSGDPNAAIDLMRQAISHHPDHTEAHYNLGLAYRAVGENNIAEREFRRTIELEPRHVGALNNLGAILLSDSERHDEAETAIRDALKVDPGYAEAHNNLAVLHKVRGRLGEAESEARRAVESVPRHAPTRNTLGTVLLELNRPAEALAELERAVELAPRDPSALSNLGLALTVLGRWDDAEATFRRALSADANYAKAHNNLGRTLLALGHPGDALDALERANELSPKDPMTLLNLGLTHQRLGDAEAATRRFHEAAQLKPDDQQFWQAFAESLRAQAFVEADAGMRADLEHCLTVQGVEHQVLAFAVSRLLRSSPESAPILEAIDQGSWSLSAVEVQDGDIFRALGGSLLCRLLERTIIPDYEMERLLTAVRRQLLDLAVGGRLPEKLPDQALVFLCALARQSHLNDYVYFFAEDERAQVDQLRAEIEARLAMPDDVPPPGTLAVLASYLPLFELTGHARLLDKEYGSHFGALLDQQVRDPKEEQELREDMPALTAIEDEVSREVRAQYEAHPYPRWTSIYMRTPRSLASVALELFPHLPLQAADFAGAPDILVAGCGTGAQAITDAERFLGSRVLALDLSVTSLAYGRRKARDAGIDNIEWAQADIMQLGGLERRFDFIDCGGVLHHLRDPMLGWRTLLNLLKPGGFMKIGLYSEIARRDIPALAAEISGSDALALTDDIRALRRKIAMQPDDSPIKQVLGIKDFYSTSECRDLLFHVQEHRFTLLKIAEMLDELSLEFVGFEMTDAAVRDRYRARFPEDPATIRLDLWHQFETAQPETFIGMYQFWVRPR